MRSRLIEIVFVVGCLGCAPLTNTASRTPLFENTVAARFVSTVDTITIDLTGLSLKIGSQTYPLEDCSTATLRCFKNETIGFHVAVPRSCQLEGDPEGALAGGFRFQQIALIEHGDPRQGRYVSTLSDRFAYGYFFDRGIVEIRYDPAGQWRFGRGSPGNIMGRAEREPYTYRLPADQAFLSCTMSR